MVLKWQERPHDVRGLLAGRSCAGIVAGKLIRGHRRAIARAKLRYR
jgi:hypothetical protein